jgi:trimeric autotransporter adhesin
MNNKWLSRQAARFAAALLVVGIGCMLASCGEGGDSTPGLQSIEVTPPNAQAAAGTSVQLSATGIYSDGSHQDVTSQVLWGSSNAAIATFAAGSGGTVSALATGAVAISATLHDRVGTTNFTVTPAVLVSIEVTPATPSVASGYTYGLMATGIFSDGTSQDLTSQVTWASSDTAVATISNTPGSNGVASTAEVGITTITATSGSISGSTTLTVTAAALMSMLVTPFDVNLPEGVSRQFTATGLFSDNSTHNVTTQVTWASSQPDTATVSNAAGSVGLVVATALGTSIISATTAGGLTATAPIAVTAAALASIQVTPSNATLVIGLPEQFTATGTFTDGSTHSLTSLVTWASSSTGVATVSNANGSNGLASTAGVGATTISATFGSVSGSTAFNVSAAQLVSIQVTPGTAGIGNGLAEQFIATGTYTNNSQQYLTTQVTWASSNTAVATISNAAGSNGLATSAGAGTTTISATSGGALSASTVLTVRQPPHLYIADDANVYLCSLNLTDGTFTGCTATGSGFQDPFGIVFTGSQAYVSNSQVATGPSVSVCNVATDGTLTACALTAANASVPTQLAVSGNTLYVADNGVAGVTYCTILSDGTLSNCGLTGTDFNSFGIATGASGNIYVTNNSGTVGVCVVGTSGAFSSCTETGIGYVASNGVALVGNLAYVTSAIPSAPGVVDVCPINVDGTFGTCTASALPAGATPFIVSVVGSHAYVSDAVTGMITLCTVSSVDGSLSNCAVYGGSGVSFWRPSQIAAF